MAKKKTTKKNASKKKETKKEPVSNNNAKSEWSGLTVALLSALQQEICRCRLRTELSKDHAGTPRALCRLNQKVWQFIERNVVPANRPRKGDLTEFLKTFDVSIRGNHVSAYLKDQIGDDASWNSMGYNMFTYLLRGPNPANDDRGKLVKDITYYFFRDRNRPEEGFLSSSRLPFGEPCSITELAGELAWAVRQVTLTNGKGSKGQLVLVSGKHAFPFRNQANEHHVGQAIADAVAAKIKVVFIHGDSATDAEKSLKQFEVDNPGLKGNLSCIGVDETQPLSWHFLPELFMFIYLDVLGDDDSTTLFMVRALLAATGSTVMDGAMVWEGTRKEVAAFKQWLSKVSPANARSEN
jgi:hypothetical protein